MGDEVSGPGVLNPPLELVEHYVDHDTWFREQVRKGLDPLDQGEYRSHQEVGDRIERMFRSQMQVRWSPEAYEDLAAIGYRIPEDDSEAALQVVTRISDSASGLRTFGHRGGRGRVEGTRELPSPPLPFIIVYRVLSQAVVSIIHGARPRLNETEFWAEPRPR